MFTMSKIREGSTYLDKHLSHSDYYSEKERVTGRWVGEGARLLGVSGKSIAAGDKAFENLRQNRLPDGSGRLTARKGQNRVCFFDFQVSAQKSVSVMAITLGDERLAQAHRRAADKAFGELERFAAVQANHGREGRHNQITGNVCAARFCHTASRALDPQLHEHFVTVNGTYDVATGQWKALTEKEMLLAVRYAGKVYQNELACEVRRLGYELEEIRDRQGAITGYEIKGVSASIRERFSKRRAEVERGIAAFRQEHGREPTPGETHVITTETRNAKLAEATTEQVLRWQRAELSAEELRALEKLKAEAMRRAAERSRAEPGLEREALRQGIDHIFERRSVAAEHEIVAEALNQKLGGLSLERLKAVAANEPQLVTLAEGGSAARLCATRTGLALEKWAVDYVARTKGQCERLGDAAGLGQKLSAEQREALRSLLASKDQVLGLRGAAGVGKTTALTELRQALERGGKSVVAIAPTTSAAATLRKEGFQSATTVAQFLLKDARESGAETVLLVDESGMLSNKQGAALLRWAEASRGRVLFVGDSRQHSGVEAGDFLRVLEKHSPMERAEIRTVRRQQSAAYREAVQAMASGSVRAGLEKLDGLGWVREGKAEYLANAAREYLRLKGEGGGKVVCVCPTWAENHALTDEIRRQLRAAGRLEGGRSFTVHESLSWTAAQRANFRNYRAGLFVTFNAARGGFAKGSAWEVISEAEGKIVLRNDRGRQRALDVKNAAASFDVAGTRCLEIAPGDWVLLRDNDRRAGLLNGRVHQVKGIEGDVLRFEDGVRLDTQRFHRFLHGYAITSHKAQGMTVDHVVVAASRLDGKAAYVACSRGKLSCSVHTPDKEALMGRLASGDRKIALDFQPTDTGDSPGLNRLKAFQAVAQNKVLELGQRVSMGLAGLRLPGWQHAVELLNRLSRTDFDESKTREQDRT
jgi:conjugative relaxase-like TrwC/TraI family protein